ncbi:hypothetical protein Lal_00030029 [Lupinus albus]|nr:hypothetical protein Lal_00030029 [Lupinus albus]
MVIIRDVVSDFSDEDEIELCNHGIPIKAIVKEIVYGLEFQPIGNEEYWPSYYRPSFIPNPIMRRKRSGRPKTTRIHNEMDEVQPQLIKKCRWRRT